MLLSLDFISSTTNHIKSTSIFEITDLFLSNLHVLSCKNTLWTIQESEKLWVSMSSLYIVIDTNDNIVSTGCLTSRQYTTDSKSVSYVILLETKFKVKCTNLSLHKFRKDFFDLLRCINWAEDSFQKLLIENLRSSWLITFSVWVKLRLG